MRPLTRGPRLLRGPQRMEKKVAVELIGSGERDGRKRESGEGGEVREDAMNRNSGEGGEMREIGRAHV